MYSVYQHWDPLKVCIVGKSYSPKFYDYIKNDKVRRVFYRIAEETEEDYQKLINLLESFGVKILRPEVSDNHNDYHDNSGKILPPPMVPRDYVGMFGSNFFIPSWYNSISDTWDRLAGYDWPSCPNNQHEFDALPKNILNELKVFGKINYKNFYNNSFSEIIDHIKKQGNNIIFNKVGLNTAEVTRIGKDIYFGIQQGSKMNELSINEILPHFDNYRCHNIHTMGHSDGTFCPVVPGLIISLLDIPTYENTFPGWEVVYLPNQSWEAVSSFLKLKEKNNGKWWVPGEELNDDFTNFVEIWMNSWVGYVEETVFDVNILVIDQKNVVCNNYNKKVFDAFSKYGITPHVINFRHRYFWDGGLHCITSDLHREGIMQDYFPERG